MAVQILIDVGVNVNCRDSAGNTPLHYACRNKPASFIRTLIEAKAIIQARNIETGHVAPHETAKYGNMEAVQEILSVDAPRMPRTTMGEFPMDLAREKGHNEIADFLQKDSLPPASTFKLYSC